MKALPAIFFESQNLAVNPHKKFLSKDTLKYCKLSQAWAVSLSRVIILCRDVNEDSVWDNKDVPSVVPLLQDKQVTSATLMSVHRSR